MKQEMTGWQWHQLDHMYIICTLLQTYNHASTSSLIFYGPDALPDAQPTASKHWRQLGCVIAGEGTAGLSVVVMVMMTLMLITQRRCVDRAACVLIFRHTHRRPQPRRTSLRHRLRGSREQGLLHHQHQLLLLLVHRPLLQQTHSRAPYNNSRYCAGHLFLTPSGRHRHHYCYLVVLFCSLAILSLKVGHTMNVLSPFISILCHSDWLFHRESCPRLDVVYPGHAWSSSPSCTWHFSLHYFFLQAILLFPCGMTIVS